MFKEEDLFLLFDYIDMKNSDTIAAIATAASESGISIIRVSGPDSLSIGDRIFKSIDNKRVSEYKTHTIHYGFIVEGENVVDEVILSIMKAPKSYTTEDTIEINCHGGLLITQKILGIVIANGARIAMPGEFTKRAFLNGRIDLTKAEAIMDIISADNDFALKTGIRQLRGDLYEAIRQIRADIIHEIAFIESALDDPEHISLDGYNDRLFLILSDILNRISKLSSSYDNGKIVKDGILTVIVGKPNAGKSSFLNILLGEDKAIVTDIAGTTRDALEENIKINNISLNIVDTAGIRFTSDEVEKIGVHKAKQYINQADLVLYMVDVSTEIDENDREIIKLLKDKKVIVLFNKCDLEAKVTKKEVIDELKQNGVISENVISHMISAKEQTGIDEFEDIIGKFVFDNDLSVNSELLITSLRQKEQLDVAFESINMVINSINDGMPEDFYTIDMMNAYSALGNIIGEEVNEDLVNEIFAKFCMGK